MMQLVDLVTPWSHASTHPDDESDFRHRHRALIDAIRWQRAPTSPTLRTPRSLRALATTIDKSALLPTLHTSMQKMAEHGWRLPERVILWAGVEPGDVAEVIPSGRDSMIVLFVDRAKESELQSALIQAIVASHRWTDPNRQNPIAQHECGDRWERWRVAQRVPLAEWIYTAGIGVHALAEQHPESSDAEWLGVSTTTLNRLREQERALRATIEGEFESASVGSLMRWLNDDAPPGMRRGPNGMTMPRGVGRYLGWRMTRTRVQRVGALVASTMSTG